MYLLPRRINPPFKLPLEPQALRQEGLQNPITVRLVICSDPNCQLPRLVPFDGLPPCPEGCHYHTELIAGERRTRAAGILGWTTIDAKLIQTVSEAEAAAKGLIENLQRKDLNPIEEAEGIQAMLDLHDTHWTQEQIGKVIGKSQSDVSETLRLLDLSEKVKTNIGRRIISPGHALAILRQQARDLDDDLTHWLEYVAEGLVMTLRRTKSRIESLGIQHAAARLRLTPKQEELLRIFRGQPRIAAAGLTNTLKISRERVSELVRPLIDAGIVLREGRTRATTHRLNSK